MSEFNFDTAVKFKSVLGKESPKLFGGFQNRFFFIIEGSKEKNEGYLLAYSEKEGSQIKGAIPFTDITEVTSTGKKDFTLVVVGRNFKLRADTEKLKDDWINALTVIIKENISNSSKQFSRQATKSSDANSFKAKNWKIENQSKEVIDAISKQGLSVSKDNEFSSKLLEIKGIKKLLRGIPQDLLNSRMKHGFMQKKHKTNNMIGQRRWFFLLSARPLTIEDQIIDDITLDEKDLPSSIKFDILYYYTAEDEQDSSSFKGEIILSECSRLEAKENDKEFFLIIDMNNRIFEFSSEIGWERDSWFHSLTNSRKTAKDIYTSKTKRPRNIISLVEFLGMVGGQSKVEKVIENEIHSLTKDFSEIKDIKVLQAMLKKIDARLIQTLDGCQIYAPPQIELMRLFAENYNIVILQKIQTYWKYLIDNLSVSIRF